MCIQIRPIDKKLNYQIKKLTNLTNGNPIPMEDVDPNKPVAPDDSLKLRPNPDMLIDKFAPEVLLIFIYLSIYNYEVVMLYVMIYIFE